MDPYADLHARIEELCERAVRGVDGDLALEMNDLLSEGYARALLAEQEVVAMDERVVEALLQPDPDRARELRALTAQRHATARAVERLREHLDTMHARYLALRAR
jgi:hypothetical protein